MLTDITSSVLGWLSLLILAAGIAGLAHVARRQLAVAARRRRRFDARYYLEDC